MLLINHRILIKLLEKQHLFYSIERKILFMSELQRLKSLLPPENESWVFIEAAAAIDPP